MEDQQEDINRISEFDKEKTISAINCINISSQPYGLTNHLNYIDFAKKFFKENYPTKIKIDMVAKCPSCPGDLVIRKMKNVYKLGCSNYSFTKCGEIIELADIDTYLVPDEELETYNVTQDSELFMLKSINQNLELENINLKQQINNLLQKYRQLEQVNSHRGIKIKNDFNSIEKRYNELKEENNNFKKSLLYKIHTIFHKT